MNPKLIDSVYNPKKKRASLKLEINHPIYGNVLCSFHIKLKEEIIIELSSAFVEGMMIPLKKHKELLLELKSNQELLETVKVISSECIKTEPKIIEEKKVKEAGGLSHLNLDYVVILSSRSFFSKTINRSGPKLGNVIEEDNLEHRVWVMVKFKEMLDGYELMVNYRKATGYKVKLTNSLKNRNKLNIKDYLDEDACKGIIMEVRRKVEFLP